MTKQRSIIGWLAAVLSCAGVLGIFYGVVFIHPNIAEHGISIMSGIAVGTVVRAAVEGKLRRNGEQESEDH